MKQLAIVVDPVETDVSLRHDDGGGAVWSGVPGTASDGRPAKIITIPDGIPEGHGARLTMTAPSRTSLDPRGRVIWNHRSDGLAEFTCDDFILPARPFDPRRLPRLVTRGQFFALETGERFTAIQGSDFNLLARWITEGPEAVEPVLQQRAALGFNLLRVWTFMQLSQYGIGDLNPHDYPDFYSRMIPEFAGHCAAHGLYVEFTAYTGSPGRDDHSHWAKLGTAAQSCTNVILELVNENDQAGNALDASQFSPIPGVLCSHGSNGSQAQPVQPFWDYATFHTNGASEEQRKVGHNAMEIWSGPSLTDETSRFPDVGMWSGASPDRQAILAHDSSAGAALLCAGSCFHSVCGKRSSLFDADHLRVATAWVAGAHGVPLEFQDGRYMHRDDLEPPGVLRTYERRLNDGRGHIEVIHA